MPPEHFIFYWEIDQSFEKLFSEYKVDPLALATRQGCENKIWIVLGLAERLAGVYSKYPGLLNSTIVYLDIYLYADEYNLGIRQLDKLAIRSRTNYIGYVRAKIHFTSRFYSEIDLLMQKEGKSYEEAYQQIHSTVLKLCSKMHRSKDH